MTTRGSKGQCDPDWNEDRLDFLPQTGNSVRSFGRRPRPLQSILKERVGREKKGREKNPMQHETKEGVGRGGDGEKEGLG